MFVLCLYLILLCCFCFFFSDAATLDIYTLSLHDALPIYFGCGRSRRAAGGGGAAAAGVAGRPGVRRGCADRRSAARAGRLEPRVGDPRSEEHTSGLQSRRELVCRLLLEKKKKTTNYEMKG